MILFNQFIWNRVLHSPNEVELTIESLTTLYNDLAAKNTAVINATVPLNTARIARDQVFYEPLTGVIDISLDVKTYVKSVFGATSPQFKLISKLEFKSVKS